MQHRMQEGGLIGEIGSHQRNRLPRAMGTRTLLSDIGFGCCCVEPGIGLDDHYGSLPTHNIEDSDFLKHPLNSIFTFNSSSLLSPLPLIDARGEGAESG